MVDKFYFSINFPERKILETYLLIRVPMYFPGYFQVKAMKSKVNLASNQSLC